MDFFKRLIKALLAGPGPRDLRETLILMMKGVSMGTADIIPGVSGGTLAFITGIYSSLVSAIAAIDGQFFKYLFSFEIIKAVEHLHTRFLIPLLSAIFITVILLAQPMHYLLTYYQMYTWSFFFGLISFSIFVVGREIESYKKFSILVAIFLGAIFAYLLVGLIPVTTPNDYWFIFLSGAVGAIAMILPGISGAFILLLIGKYQYITGILKDPFTDNHLIILTIFCFGIATGLVSFSKTLKFLFHRYPQITYAVLAGFMIGAMRKIWPWKEVIQEKIIDGQSFVLQEGNIFPPELNSSVFYCILLAIIGGLIVFVIDFMARKKS